MFLLNLYVWQFLIFSVYFGTSLPAVVRTVLLLYSFFQLFAFWYFFGIVQEFFSILKIILMFLLNLFLLISINFKRFFVVVCFGPTMEFFSCAFGHFLVFLGTCHIHFLLHFLGTFLNFSGMFNYFWNFLGPFLVCRLFFDNFCYLFWHNNMTFFLVILKTLYQF